MLARQRGLLEYGGTAEEDKFLRGMMEYEDNWVGSENPPLPFGYDARCLGISLVDYLMCMGVDFSFKSRMRLAEAHGLKYRKGRNMSEQSVQLLMKLREDVAAGECAWCREPRLYCRWDRRAGGETRR